MFKRSQVFRTLAAALFFVPVLSFAGQHNGSGTIGITGMIAQSACTASPDDDNMAIYCTPEGNKQTYLFEPGTADEDTLAPVYIKSVTKSYSLSKTTEIVRIEYE